MVFARQLPHALALLVLLGCARQAPAGADRQTTSSAVPTTPTTGSELARSAPFALVELFTSEGCSSCPPADRHLAEIDSDAHSKTLNVHALSFHVDYWNYLGWRDPFSDSAYSKRQTDYARRLTSGRVYTPQMIVNGQEEFVGSDRAQARAALTSALEQRAGISVELTPHLNARRLEVDYLLEGDTHDAILHLAVTQPLEGVRVERGENAGEVLAHSAVVRAFASHALSGAFSGTKSLELPVTVVPRLSKLIGFVADRDSLAVRGAASVQLGD